MTILLFYCGELVLARREVNGDTKKKIGPVTCA
jgi:hypothetical protein